MESKAFVPATTKSPGSSSSSFIPIRASPSYDSDIEIHSKNDTLKFDKKKGSESSSSSSSSSSSDDGFVSGDEEFETASERPFVADPDDETLGKGVEGVVVDDDDDDDDYDGPFVDSFTSSLELPRNVMPPIAKLSMDDEEEEEDVVESPKARVFGGGEIGGSSFVVGKESFLGEQSGSGSIGGNTEVVGMGLDEPVKSYASVLKESGVDGVEPATVENFVVDDGENAVIENSKSNEGVGLDVERGSVLEKQQVELIDSKDEKVEEGDTSKVLDVNEPETVKETEEVSSNFVELEADKSVKTEDVSFTPESDSVVEAIHVDLAGPGTVVVGKTEEAAEAVEKMATVGGGIDQVSSNVVELEADKFVKTEDVSFTPEGDSVVEALHVNLAGPGTVVVGDSEESKYSTVKEAEVPVDEITKMNNGFDQTGHDDRVPVPVHSELVGESDDHSKNGESVTVDEVKTSELEPLEPETEVVGVGNKEGIDSGAVILDTVAKSMDDEKRDVCADESKVDQFHGEEKSETGMGSETDSEFKLNGAVVKIPADGAEFVSNDKVVGRDGREMKGMQDIAQSTETESPQNSYQNGCIQSGESENGVPDKDNLLASAEPSSALSTEVNLEAEDETKQDLEEEGEIEGSDTDEETDGMIFGSSEAAKKFLEELEQGSAAGSHSGAESSRDYSQRIDGQIVTDSDEEEEDTDEEGEGKELFDSAALAALLKAATGAGSDGGNITITSQDGSRLFSVERPAGLGSSLRSVKPAPRPNRSNLFAPSHLTTGGDAENNLSEEEKKKLEKIQQLRVKFLRLVQRLGHSPEESIAAQVLYRLVLVAGRPTSQLFSLDAAKQTALQLEAEGKDDLDFSLNVLVLGKTGVGKSATINSIFGEQKASIDAFEPATTTVKEITGMVGGVKVRVFDTPGLRSSVMEQGINRRTLSAIKNLTKKCPPDIVLYVDRLDTQTRDLNDLPLLKTITSCLGSSIWRNAIVTLTHGASAPPDGPAGLPLSYEVFVTQRSHVVQQSIGQAVGDMRLMNPSLMNPVSLAENHPSCRKNRDGQKVLPNGQTWRPQLLLLCYSMKILSEASSLSKPQDPFDHRKLFGFRVRSPPLPYLLSWLLQSRPHPKLPSDQGGDNGDSDIDLDDISDSDGEEEEDEYDQLPPFRPLRKSQLAKLNKEQRKAYFEEYDYRVKLLQKKQWREELKRMREIKKKGKVSVDEYGYPGDDMDQENGAPAAVPVPLPDMVLPPSFDSDNPAYRYRFLEPTSQLLTRPVLDPHGWDHDCGYDGVVLEQNLAIAGMFPAAGSAQITKDKKEFNIHLDSSVATKLGENGSGMAGFDIQNIGKQLAYIVRGDYKFKILKKNKTAAGFSVTFLGENVATGFKFEDQVTVGKRVVLVGSAGTVRSQGDSAYGANMEVRLRESDFPVGQDQTTLGLSLVKWRGDLALGGNLQSQFSIGRSSKMAVRVGLNNKLSGQITVRTTSSDQLQIALMAIIPIASTIYKAIWPGVGENYSNY